MYRASTERWYLERIVWFIAGMIVLGGTLLGFFVNRYWLALPLLAGTNMIVFAWTGFCPLAVFLYKFGVRPFSEAGCCNRS